MKQLHALSLRLRSIILLSVLIAGQVTLPLSPFLQKAHAAPICVVDTADANDEPGQKDLSRMCSDESSSTSLDLTWQWDEIEWSGNNTGDACSLFDTDNDGNANYSVCVTIGGNAVQQANSPRIYTCGDDAEEKCTQPIGLVAGPYTSTCSVNVQNVDPFSAGDENPKDAVATCTIALSEVGGEDDAKLIDVCSYPSQQPNSDPSDCIVFQTKSGKIEVIKELVPSTDRGKFNLLIDGIVSAVDVGNAGTTGEKTVSVATHTVSESAGTNTNLSNYSSSVTCRLDNGQGTGTVIAQGTGNTIQVPVADDEDIICKFTNTGLSSITITKDAKPNHSQDFAFTTTGTGLTNFSLDDDGDNANTLSNTKVFNNLQSGTYSVTETAVVGWDFKDIVCTGGSVQTNGTTVTINLTAGQNVTCTYTNLKRGTITVHKVTDPANDPTVFSVTATGSGSIAGNATRDLTTSQDVVYDVAQGTYSVNEQVPTGWAQSGNTCTNLVINATNLSATCSITNTKLAKLKIVKDALPNDVQDFAFTALGSGLSGFTLDDDADVTNSNEQQFVDLMPGAYSVTEQPVAGWALTGLSCNSNNYTANGSTVSVNLGAGQETTCTYVNTKLGSISGTKYTANSDSSLGPVLGGWAIFIDSNNNGIADQNEQSTVTDQNGTYSFLDLLPGNYILKEVLLSGWTQIFGTNPVELDAGETSANNNFGNFQNGSIGGFKWNDVDGNGLFDASEPKLSSWEIKLFDGHNNILSTTTTDGNGTYNFDNLAPGTYSVCETQQTSWVQTFPANNACHTIVINISDESNEANFGNQGRGNVTVIKNVDSDGDGDIDVQGATDWTWDIDGSGNFATGSTQNVAAGDYTVSEDQKTGYHVTGVVCNTRVSAVSESVQITVTAGSTVTCTFTNTRDAGTITVNKVVEPWADNGLFDLRIDGNTYADDVGDGGTTNVVILPVGTYNVSEVAGMGTSLSDYDTFYSCTNDNEDEIASGTTTQITGLDLALGENIVCTFTNTHKANITVIKDAAPDNPQDFDFNLCKLIYNGSEWAPTGCGGFQLDDDNDPILSNGKTAQVSPGFYQISEESVTSWQLTDISCEGAELSYTEDGKVNLYVPAGGEIVCVFTNTAQEVALNIEKSNDSPNPVNLGSTVTYALTVSVPQDSGTAYDVKVNDLPPENFEYVPGSWTAVSSVRGDLKAEGTTTEPTYASPGQWLLGNMIPGEIVTLTYKVIVGQNVTAGVYPDVAFAVAQSLPFGGSQVLSNVSTGADTPFVGTRVTVTTPQVLGATVLVETGTPLAMQYAAAAALTILMAIITTRVRRQAKGGRA